MTRIEYNSSKILTLGDLNPGDIFRWHSVTDFDGYWMKGDVKDYCMNLKTGDLDGFPDHREVLQVSGYLEIQDYLHIQD